MFNDWSCRVQKAKIEMWIWNNRVANTLRNREGKEQENAQAMAGARRLPSEE